MPTKKTDDTVSVTVRIPREIFEWLDEHHWAAKTSRSAFAADLLVEAVNAERG